MAYFRQFLQRWVSVEEIPNDDRHREPPPISHPHLQTLPADSQIKIFCKIFRA